MNDDVMLGFDGTADDVVSVVVMRRDPGGSWQMESSDGPDADELVRQFAEAARTAIGEIHDRQPDSMKQPVDWSELTDPSPELAERAEAWIRKFTGSTFVLDEQQKAFLRHMYEQPLRDGRIRL